MIVRRVSDYRDTYSQSNIWNRGDGSRFSNMFTNCHYRSSDSDMVKTPDRINLLEVYRGIRKVWTINPETKVVDKDKKKKSRAKRKKEFLKETDSWKETCNE